VVQGGTVCGAEDAKGPGAKRNKIKLQWNFIPLSGFATEGEPRTCQRRRIAERSKDFFSIFLVRLGNLFLPVGGVAW
jgi:hypothetical protein